MDGTEDGRIEEHEIDGDLVAFDEVNGVLRIERRRVESRIPASLPYGYPSWDEWWPKSTRPPWVNETASIPSHQVDRRPDTANAMWNLAVVGTIVAHGWGRYIERDTLQLLPVVQQAVIVRQCQASGCENVLYALSTSEPALRDCLSDLPFVKPQRRYCFDPECQKRRTRERVAEHRRRRSDVTKSGSMDERAFSPSAVNRREEPRMDEIESLDARISRLEELLRLNLELTVAAAEKIRSRLPDDPRIAEAVDKLTQTTQQPKPRRVAVRVVRRP